jgi:ribulose 1,5-bisphosphate carboxylase large subunit-like protein
MRVLKDHAGRTGKMVMYAANITGEMDEMLRRHEQVVAAGGTCVMVSIHSVGLPAVAALRRAAARSGPRTVSKSQDAGNSRPPWGNCCGT